LTDAVLFWQRLQKYGAEDRTLSTTIQKIRLFSMMALQLAIWGAWAPKLFPYMGMLGFSASQQALVGCCWGIASVVGIFSQINSRTAISPPNAFWPSAM
jgi:hypothetical protein